MPITLNETMPSEGPTLMYSQGFRQLIEDHLQFLRNHDNTEVVDINPQSAYKGEGDLVSVLQDYQVEPQMHWIIMRVNDYTSPMQYRADHLSLLVPSQGVIDGLLRIHRVNLKLAKKQQAA
jgi:hypothetical protein